MLSFERSINRLIKGECRRSLFFLGSSGGVIFATDERRDQVVREAVRIVNHRVLCFVRHH